MDINPDEATRYFEDVDYPANKDDLAFSAEGNGASGVFGERLRTLGWPSFSGSDEVVAVLKPSPTSG